MIPMIKLATSKEQKITQKTFIVVSIFRIMMDGRNLGSTRPVSRFVLLVRCRSYPSNIRPLIPISTLMTGHHHILWTTFAKLPAVCETYRIGFGYWRSDIFWLYEIQVKCHSPSLLSHQLSHRFLICRRHLCSDNFQLVNIRSILAQSAAQPTSLSA